MAIDGDFLMATGRSRNDDHHIRSNGAPRTAFGQARADSRAYVSVIPDEVP